MALVGNPLRSEWFGFCFIQDMPSPASLPILDVNKFDGAIFDLDGVVTQTARLHAAAWKQLFDAYLHKHAAKTSSTFHPFDLVTDYRNFVDGKPRYDGVHSFLSSRGIHLPAGSPSDPQDRETIYGLGNRKNAFFLATLHTRGVATYPATIAFIQKLRRINKKTAVVTASENYREILEAAHVSNLFDIKVDGQDARTLHLQGKPQPDTFLKAAALLDIPPERAVVFEDALAGVAAGQAGHFGMVVGLDRADQSEALHAQGANLVIEDLEKLALRDSTGNIWRSAHALPSAIQNSTELISRLNGKRLVVFLDYDGTLTPIVERPELAVLPQDTREVLRDLSERCTVAIISGRDRPVVEQFINLDSLIYAGSHGFDIAGPPGLVGHHEIGNQHLPSLNQVEKELQLLLPAAPGLLIERKKFSIAVHYRMVAEDRVPTVQATIESIMSRHPDLRGTEGKKVFEFQPRLDWDKGQALLWLLDHLPGAHKDVLPLYIGDDLTDEDAFRVLMDFGVSIVVENGFRFSCAQYALTGIDQVKTFLKDLGQYMKARIA